MEPTPRMVKRCAMPDCSIEIDGGEKYCAACIYLKAIILLKAVNG